MFDRQRPPPILACDAACGALSRDARALYSNCTEPGCRGVQRLLEATELHAHVCRFCRGIGTADHGGEACRCSGCGGEGWRLVKDGRIVGRARTNERPIAERRPRATPAAPDTTLDRALEDTFPASDPTASQVPSTVAR